MLFGYVKSYVHPNLFCLAFLVACALPLSVSANTADEIIKKVQSNLNGETAVMNMSMVVKNKRSTRTMKLKSYSIGDDKSFIQILYPGKDKGITFLKIDNSMWQYVPRIEKTIKIPASMMLQSWMGSDFTNDDLVKTSSLDEDYVKKLLAENEEEYQVELLPTEEAAVVWGKIIMDVSKQFYLPTTVLYYDEDDTLIRKMIYTNVQPFGKKYYPTKWMMLPQEPEKKGNETIIEISDAVFDEEISESYFTKRALKRYSN